MSADIIPFPNCGIPDHPTTKVKIHCELDDTFVVTILPCPPGAPPRRAFLHQGEAYSYADGLARQHSVICFNGNPSWSVTWTGPEASA
ncbi:hypothetical protein [Sphingopyxis macrogoltabida]|uniref:hypothetical protein n=1 Tax=Sphingopyxis macrogoltabida TaxID=33050 RepID=UPI0006ED3934|nr:hypothetical protein [Sphingopyxis macrogoltabida]ALJ15335.1 hypothetical protein LH19_20870 [Sphingopyxis macrogoltabida]